MNPRPSRHPVFVLGGWHSDFARNLAREGASIEQLVGEGVDGALDAAAVEVDDVDAVHVANAFGELFAGQSQLGAMPATARPGLWGVPATRHEAACASGSMAVLGAMADLEAGRYDCALVVGVEQERNVPGDVAARHLGAAAHTGREGEGARYLWPHMFSRVADAYAARYGLRDEHLRAIARKNFEHARANPLAQTRAWRFTDASFSDDDVANPVVEGRLRRHDCGQVTDGAASLVLASEPFARAWAARRGRSLDGVPRVLGWGHRTVGLGLDEKLRRSAGSPYVMPHLRGAVTDAFARAALPGVEAVDGVEVHDCFTITEYLAIDHLGLTAPGASWQAIESGALRRGARFPVNPSGGLIGLGHPVGATGVRMVFDAARQVSGAAGACQVEGARRFATLNLGGSATTVACFVVGVS